MQPPRCHICSEWSEIIKGTDALILSVGRPGYWQNLQFPDSEARNPFHDSLDPLLKWLDTLKKQSHVSLPEDSVRNNCLPPGDIQLRTRSSRGDTASTSQQPLDAARPGIAQSVGATSASFMMRMWAYRLRPVAGGRELEHDCLLVYGDGKYHREIQSQKFSESHTRSTIIEGSVQSDRLQVLRDVLNDPKLQRAGEKEPPEKMPFQEMEYTSLIIPRGDHVQKANFWKFFSAYRTGSAGMPLIEENGMKQVKPLKEWVKANVEENGSTLEAKKVADCASAQTP